jgi:hypothetical protein
VWSEDHEHVEVPVGSVKDPMLLASSGFRVERAELAMYSDIQVNQILTADGILLSEPLGSGQPP